MSETSQEIFDHLVEDAKERYHNYHILTDVMVVDGVAVEVEFHRVGHNASHQFAIGILPDGRLVKRSTGEGSEWDYELDQPTWETSIHIINETRWPYVGHY